VLCADDTYLGLSQKLTYSARLGKFRTG